MWKAQGKASRFVMLCEMAAFLCDCFRCLSSKLLHRSKMGTLSESTWIKAVFLTTILEDQSVCLLEKWISSPPTKRGQSCFTFLSLSILTIQNSVFLWMPQSWPLTSTGRLWLPCDLSPHITHKTNQPTNQSNRRYITASGEKCPVFFKSSGLWSTAWMEAPCLETSGSQPSYCCGPSVQFLQLWSIPTTKLFWLQLRNCNFVTVINYTVNIRHVGYLICDSCQRVIQTPK